MSRVLITGGAGYIGSHTAKQLFLKGYEPIVLDNLSTGHEKFVKWGPLLKNDLSAKDDLQKIIKKWQPVAVIHFASSSLVHESFLNPNKYFYNNVINTINLLDVIVNCGIDKFIFSSSCAVYGDPTSKLISENETKTPLSPYGESKLMIEKILNWHTNIHKMRSVSLRYFNAAGADHDGEIGEAHNPETHLIPLVINAALKLQDTIKVFGNNYKTTDGTPIRDYVHVSDIAKAHINALEYLLQGGGSVELNLGTGIGYSVLEIIRAVENISGKKIAITMEEKRDGDAPILVADSSKAAKVLHWTPKCSEINEIIETAYNWQKSLT